MRAHHIFTLFSVVVLVACAIVILGISSRSTGAQDDGLKAQMQQEIIQALQEIVALHEQALKLAQAKQREALTSSLEVEEAQLKLSEARLRLAVAEHKPDIAMKEFRNILTIHEKQLQLIESKAKQGLASRDEVAKVKLQLLEERIRLATAIRDMQFPLTPTLRERTGQVHGRIIGKDSGQPLGGAMVVLCEIMGDFKCKLRAKLRVIADEDGNFILSDVPPGDYTAFWAPAEKVATVSLDDGRVEDFAAGGLTPVTAGGTVMKTGLSFAFLEKDFDPHFTVSAGGIVQVEIKGWGK